MNTNKDFDIVKAEQLLQEYSQKKDKLKKSLLTDLINYHRNLSRSIVNEELLIEKRYSKNLVSSVLNDLGYDLVLFKHNSCFKRASDKREPEYHLIIFEPTRG